MSKTSTGVVLFTVNVAIFFVANILSATSIALPAIGKEFNADAFVLGWIGTVSFLTSTVLLIPFGRLSDIVGIRRIYGYGMVLYTVTSIFLALSDSVYMLIVLRAVQGISIAMVVGNSTAMVSAVYPPGKRGRALGITSGSVYVGLSAGPFVGGFLTESFGWRSIFVLNLIVGLLIIILVYSRIKDEWRGSPGEKLDKLGAGLFSLSFIALIYGFSMLPETQGIIFMAGGIAGLLMFIKYEGRVKSPLIDLSIFKRNKTFVYSNIAALVNYMASSAMIFLMSLYLQYIKGFSPLIAGLIIASQTIAQACLSPIMGRLSDRVEPRVLSSLGMGVSCISLVPFIFIDENTSAAMIVVYLVAMGLGMGTFVSPNTNGIMSSVAPKSYGMASAMLSTMRQVGSTFSMSIVMILFTVIMGRVVVTEDRFPDFLTCIHVSSLISVMLALVGIYFSYARGKIHSRL